MAPLPILKWPDPRLSTVCDPVAPGEDLAGLIADMFQTMYAAPGRGLAAPQVGVLKRLFVMDCTWKEGEGSPLALINPRLLERSDTIETGEEGCLSIPGITTAIDRPDWVVVAWTGPDGAQHARRFEGFEARCAQHETDHLDGIVTLQHLDGAARAEAEARYAAARA